MRIILLGSLVFICGFSGISYQNYSHDTATQVHVLTLDPSKVTIKAVRAQDLGVGLDTVVNLADHFSAVAAINGGFFRVNYPISVTGLPAGILKINDKWHGIAYKPRGAVGWDPNTNTTLFDIVQTDSSIMIADRSLPIHAMNNILEGSRASVLSDSYMDKVNLRENIGILFKNQHVKEIYSSGTVDIPKGSYLYNINGALRQQVENISIDDPIELQISTLPLLDKSTAGLWAAMPNIIGGGPLLIKDGKILDDYSVEKFSAAAINSRRAARTAVGILANGDWVFVVAEESFISEGTGMTFRELAEFMYNLKCVAALNLDGGSSSCMYLDPSIASGFRSLRPTRPVADALVVTLKQP